MRDELRRFLVDAGRTIGASSQDRGWRTLALAGEERLVAAFTSGIPAGSRLELARIRHLERWRSHGELAHAVAPTFAVVRERREADLVRKALDGGGAALGVRESLSALADARVEILLVAAERRLVDTGEVAPRVAEGEPAGDPMLADRMIGRALETGASVVVLSDGPARLLGDDVAALLRY
jgi:hypothetical protein